VDLDPMLCGKASAQRVKATLDKLEHDWALVKEAFISQRTVINDSALQSVLAAVNTVSVALDAAEK
jgi:hypothetical protein